jgi:hypothetical protein
MQGRRIFNGGLHVLNNPSASSRAESEATTSSVWARFLSLWKGSVCNVPTAAT